MTFSRPLSAAIAQQDASTEGSGLLPLAAIQRIGLAGIGSVGTAWAALLLARGYEVLAFDAQPGAVDKAREGIKAVWPAFAALGITAASAPPLDRLRESSSLEELAADSDLVQENVAEAIAVKADVIRRIDAVLPPDRLLLSSTGGVMPSRLQAHCIHPSRVLVGHPFHPASLVPLVEVVPGPATSAEAVELAASFYEKLGKHPIKLKKGMTGHLANRLQFALLREAIHCVHEGVAGAEEVDAAMRFGLGPRWAIMGPLMTFNLSGGDDGIDGVLPRFGKDIASWWASLGSVTFTPEVVASLREGMAELRRGRSSSEWGAWRDAKLVEVLQLLARLDYPGERPS
jgi:3-hydroxyacyl-CoA dehydrogenase